MPKKKKKGEEKKPAKKKAASREEVEKKLGSSKKKAVAKKKASTRKGAVAGKKSVTQTKTPTKKKAKTLKKAVAGKKAARPPKAVAPPKGPKKNLSQKKQEKTVAANKKQVSAKVTKKKAIKKTPALKKKKPAPGKAIMKASPEKPKAVEKKIALPSVIEVVSESLKGDISTVLVTSAAGCIGTFLIKNLLKEGYSVTAVDKNVDDIPVKAGKKPLLLKSGDLSSPKVTAECMENVDAVFHVAGQADGKHIFTGPESQSVREVRTLFQEARRRGVKRFILFSSATVYKKSPGPISETEPLEAHSEVEQTQIEMERVVLGEALPGLPVVTVIRPAWVYGPQCSIMMGSVAALAALVKTLGPYYIRLSGGPKLNLVHGEDVARAASYLLLMPKAYNEIYNIADKDPMVFGEFLNQVMESYGLEPLQPGVPYPPSTLLQSILPYVEKEEIFNPLGQLSSVLWQRMIRSYNVKKALSPRIDQELTALGSRNFVVDNQRLIDLGFRLKYPKFQKGWQKTMAWYQDKGWIPRPEDIRNISMDP